MDIIWLFFLKRDFVSINPGLIQFIRIFLLESSNDKDFTSPIRAAFEEEYKTWPGVPLVIPDMDDIITIDASLSKYFFYFKEKQLQCFTTKRVFNLKICNKIIVVKITNKLKFVWIRHVAWYVSAHLQQRKHFC